MKRFKLMIASVALASFALLGAACGSPTPQCWVDDPYYVDSYWVDTSYLVDSGYWSYQYDWYYGEYVEVWVDTSYWIENGYWDGGYTVDGYYAPC